jgi:hypothetical protein
VMQMQFDHGADINGDYSNTLQKAALEGDQNVVQMLLNRGADERPVVESGCGSFAGSVGQMWSMARLFVQRGEVVG